MIAVDTNVVVRLLTEDDKQQTEVAKSLFASGPIWISKTVLLESGWVLKFDYGFTEAAIREALTELLGLRHVFTEDKPGMVAALSMTARGVGFADAMHLSSAPAGVTFVSFDRTFIRRAKRAGALVEFAEQAV